MPKKKLPVITSAALKKPVVKKSGKKKTKSVLLPEAEYQKKLQNSKRQVKGRKGRETKAQWPDESPIFDKPKHQRQLFFLVFFSMAVIFVFWLVFLKNNFLSKVPPTVVDSSTAQDWEKFKQEISQSFKNFRQDAAALSKKWQEQKSENVNVNQLVSAEPPVLTAAQVKELKDKLFLAETESWPVYRSQGYNFSFKYPVGWQITKQRTATGVELVLINSPAGGESINIAVAAKLPLAEWSAVKLSDSDWAGQPAVLYQTGQDPDFQNYLVTDLAGSQKAIAISASGASGDLLSQVLLTFKWSK